MAKTYTAEELQKCDKEMLAAIILSMQDQITTLNRNMEKLTECLYILEPEADDVIQPKPKKQLGKRDEDLKNLPVEVIQHSIPDEMLEETFGASGWKQFPDEVYKQKHLMFYTYSELVKGAVARIVHSLFACDIIRIR